MTQNPKAFWTDDHEHGPTLVIEKWAYDQVVSQLRQTKDLLEKAIEVNKYYEEDRQKLQGEVVKLKTDMSHGDAAWGLTMAGAHKALIEEINCLRSVLSEWDTDKTCYVNWILAQHLKSMREKTE